MRALVWAGTISCLLLVPSVGSLMGCMLPLAPGPTLREESQQAKVVFVGRVLWTRHADGNTSDRQATEFVIDEVIVAHPLLQGKDRVMIPRYLPIDPKKKPGRMLIFCDVLKGELDPYRGESIDDAPLDYLKNGLKLDPKNLSKLFDYYLSFVDSPTPVFALDAALELRKVDRPDLLKIVKKHHAKRLRELARSPSTGDSARAMSALLLGACGDEADAIWLSALLESQMKPAAKSAEGYSGVLNELAESILVATSILKPDLGWRTIDEWTRDPKRDFLQRYFALRALRVLHDTKQFKIDPNRVVEQMAKFLDQQDMADFPIEDFRRWQRFDMTEKIISLYERDSHNVPIIKRTIVRFALCAAPTRPAAVAFLKKVRQETPQRVEAAEEYLKLEVGSAAKDSGGSPKDKIEVKKR